MTYDSQEITLQQFHSRENINIHVIILLYVIFHNDQFYSRSYLYFSLAN